MSGAFQPPNAVGRFPVKVRGLPWEVKERDVLSFFRGLPVLEIVWGREAGVNGRFDGDAAVLFRTRNDQLAASPLAHENVRRSASYDSYKFLMTTNLNYRPRTLAEVVDDPQAIVPTVDLQRPSKEDLIDWNTIPEPIPIRSPMQAPIQPPRGRDFVHYGLLQHVHEQLHREPLKTESYRKYFPFKSQFTIDKVRERMIFELEKRTSPDGKGCIFRLRHPIDVVQRFHAELRKARQQHEEILARHAPIEDAEDPLDFGTMQPRGSRR
ncbi:hypothetical protein M3Y99_01480300 [Aphelenchoides fujianensis]|nr:hypothetical protein M3Y99_01480300 [Aphelenchoides fujianensis]